MDSVKKVATWIGLSIQSGLTKTVHTIVYKKRVKKGTKIERFERHDSYAMPKFMRSKRVQRFIQKRKKTQSESRGHGQNQASKRESVVPLGTEHRSEIGEKLEKEAEDEDTESLSEADESTLINDPRVPSQMQDCWKDKYPTMYRLRRNPGEIGGFIVESQMTGRPRHRVPPIGKTMDVLIPVKNLTAESSEDALAEWRAETTSDYFLIELPTIESTDTLPMITPAKVDMHDLSETLTIQQAVDDVVETVDNILGESLQQVNFFSSAMNIHEEPPRSQESHNPKLTIELDTATTTIFENEYQPGPSA